MRIMTAVKLILFSFPRSRDKSGRNTQSRNALRPLICIQSHTFSRGAQNIRLLRKISNTHLGASSNGASLSEAFEAGVYRGNTRGGKQPNTNSEKTYHPMGWNEWGF